ncbi:staphylopine family metallophore export MFS transporter CntE [Paenibacillus lutrae]|uniref:MFS transporter n=1 Tax=Paenibacillus lutrae TaxID=2078573 RepID=A0A7X3FES7_9BACL|nr:MFS transporter [Paenibacillus lutrae]MVO98378.1 MFS transporter [Paenibacillus lutrae]
MNKKRLPAESLRPDQDNPFSKHAMQIYAITVFFYAIVYMVLMILPFYAASLDGSTTDIGLIMGVTMFTSMLVRPIAGKAMDKYGAHRIFVLILALFAASLFGYFVPQLWVLGLVRVIQGVVAAFFSTAMEIITMDLMSERMRGQGLSLYSLATMLPSTFGPAAALALKDTLSTNMMLLVFIGLALGNVAVAIHVSRSGHLSHLGHASAGGPEQPAKSSSWKQRALWVSSAMILLASVANGAVFTFLPLYLEGVHSPDAVWYFLTQTIVLVVCRFIGRGAIPSDGTAPNRLVGITCLLAGTGCCLLSLAPYGFTLLAAAVCNGIAFALLYPALLTFVSFAVPASARGFLIGLFIGAADFGFSLGALAMGPLAEYYSFRVMYGCCALLCLLPCVLLIFQTDRPDLNQGAFMNKSV